MHTPRIVMSLAVAVALGGAFTTGSARDLTPSAEIVRGSVAGNVYQNGGVGTDQVSDMRQHLKPFDLQLTFSEGRRNAYAADVRLRITDARGKSVFSLRDAGPMTDVSLPAGHYDVVAELGGIQRSASVDVKPGQPASLYLHWPKDAA